MGKRICVFCASSNRIAPKYVEAAARFARLAVMEGYTLVCGGSWRGLMGTLTKATLACGGEIEGVIPQFMCDFGWNQQEMTRLTVVDSMQERKRILREDVDAVVAFPGAIGTLDELLETISLKLLGQFNKPIIIFNQDDFYRSLFQFFEEMVDAKMMEQTSFHAWRVVERVEDIAPAIVSESALYNGSHAHSDYIKYGNR